MDKFIISKIEAPNNKSTNNNATNKNDYNNDLIQRLYDFGFCPGLEIEVVARVSFNSVTIVQFENTRIALNQEEFACLHGH